jgi:hypothetical protein
MKQVSTLTVRNALPKVLQDRMKSDPRNLRSEAENVLREIAFVLKMTRRIHEEMTAENAAQE